MPVPGDPAFANRIVTIEGEPKAAAAPLAAEPSRPEVRKALASEPKGRAFDPRLSSGITDPVYRTLHDFKWSDRQQHGRLAYDTMYKHGAVSAPFDTRTAFLKAYRPIFKPSSSSPTERQKQIARFCNEQLRRLGSSGDPRQGYEKLIEWFAQGMKYGFSIAEMHTAPAPFEGQSRIQIQRVVPLPQASLDHGFVPHEEFGQGMTAITDVRYRCLGIDDAGNITKAVQFWSNGNERDEIAWSGPELLSLLIYTHGGGEGNPYGQSDLYTCFAHWASIYTLEQMEEAFLDAALPYLTLSYKTPDGRPSPELHTQFLEVISKQDPTVRALAAPDATFGSAAASNPSFTEHATKKKEELRRYIFDCIFGMASMGSASRTELDTRNATDTFFRYILPALQKEISTVLTWQFARRLVDANWSNLSSEDYPQLVFQNTLGNDLRISMPLLQQVLPFVDSKRLGEFLENMVPNFDGNWIPDSHSESVMEDRAPSDPAVAGKSTPPLHQEGTPESRSDGSSKSVGQEVGT